MNIDHIASWVSVIAMAVWPVLGFVGNRVMKHLTSMDKELHTNGGASMRDAIVRIESSLEELKTDTKKNRKQVKQLKGRLETHLAEMGE